MQEKFIKRIRQDIDKISYEVSNLLGQERLFQHRIKPILKKQIKDRHFANKVTEDHYTVMLTGIRRQLGTQSQEQSLHNLLNKLEENHKLITLEWYKSEWLKDSELLKNAENYEIQVFIKNIPLGEFEEYFGTSGYLDKDIVKKDIDSLINNTDKIKTFVDKKIAHTDRNTQGITITEKEYIRSLEELEKLTQKYVLLLKQVGITLTPIIQD